MSGQYVNHPEHPDHHADEKKGFFEAAADKTKLAAHNIKEGVKDLVGKNDKKEDFPKTEEQKAADRVKHAADKSAQEVHEARSDAHGRMNDAAQARDKMVHDANNIAQDRMNDASETCSKQVKDARQDLAEKMSDNAGYIAGH